MEQWRVYQWSTMQNHFCSVVSEDKQWTESNMIIVWGIQLAVVNALYIGMRPYLYTWNQYNALNHTTCLQIIKTNKFQSCFVKGS